MICSEQQVQNMVKTTREKIKDWSDLKKLKVNMNWKEYCDTFAESQTRHLLLNIKTFPQHFMWLPQRIHEWNNRGSVGSHVFRWVHAVGISSPVQSKSEVNPCGGGLEYLHHSPASRKRRQKREPSARGYSWATLFLGDINTGTWPSRLGSFKWDSKICSWVLRDFDPRVKNKQSYNI
jgi:hypothetical protein